MALAFNDRDFLPAGVHEASLEELEKHFARFQRTDRRMKLFEKFRAYIEEVKRVGCGNSVIVDGSFVMLCVDEPEDIDLILVLPPNWDMTADLKPQQYNLLSKKRVKKAFGIDVFPVRVGSIEEQKWIEFFGQVNIKWCHLFAWPTNSAKGIVRVTL